MLSADDERTGVDNDVRAPANFPSSTRNVECEIKTLRMDLTMLFYIFVHIRFCFFPIMGVIYMLSSIKYIGWSRARTHGSRKSTSSIYYHPKLVFVVSLAIRATDNWIANASRALNPTNWMKFTQKTEWTERTEPANHFDYLY